MTAWVRLLVVSLVAVLAGVPSTSAQAAADTHEGFIEDMLGDAVAIAGLDVPDIQWVSVSSNPEHIVVEIRVPGFGQPSGYHGFSMVGNLDGSAFRADVVGNPVQGWQPQITQGCASTCPATLPFSSDLNSIVISVPRNALGMELAPGAFIDSLAVQAWVQVDLPVGGLPGQVVDYAPNAEGIGVLLTGAALEGIQGPTFRMVANGEHTYLHSLHVTGEFAADEWNITPTTGQANGLRVLAAPSGDGTDLLVIAHLRLAEGESMVASIQNDGMDVAEVGFLAGPGGDLIHDVPRSLGLRVAAPTSTLPMEYPQAGFLQPGAGGTGPFVGFQSTPTTTTWDLRIQPTPFGGLAIQPPIFPTRDGLNVSLELQAIGENVPGAVVTAKLLAVKPDGAEALAEIRLPDYPGSIDIGPSTPYNIPLFDVDANRVGFGVNPSTLMGADLILRIEAIHDELSDGTYVQLGESTQLMPAQHVALDRVPDAFGNAMDAVRGLGVVNAGEYSNPSVTVQGTSSGTYRIELVGGNSEWRHEVPVSEISLDTDEVVRLPISFQPPVNAATGSYSNPYVIVEGPDGSWVTSLFVEVVDFEVEDQGPPSDAVDQGAPGLGMVTLGGLLTLLAIIQAKRRLRRIR